MTIKEKARIAYERDLEVDIIVAGGPASVDKPQRCKIIAYNTNHHHEQGILTLGTSPDSELWVRCFSIMDIIFVEDEKAPQPMQCRREPPDTKKGRIDFSEVNRSVNLFAEAVKAAKGEIEEAVRKGVKRVINGDYPELPDMRSAAKSVLGYIHSGTNGCFIGGLISGLTGCAPGKAGRLSWIQSLPEMEAALEELWRKAQGC